MKVCILASVIGMALITPSKAQDDKAAVEKLAPIVLQLGGWHDIMAARKSLSIVAVKIGHVEPGFGHDGSPDFTGTFQLFYQGDRFLYSVEFIGGKGTNYNRAESFDGDRYKTFDRQSGTLTISAKPFQNDIVMCQGHPLFMPFLFLQSGIRKDPFTQLSYQRLTNKEDWNNALTPFPRAARVEDVNLGGRSYLKVAGIGGNIDPSSDGECLFDVYFAQDRDWYPIKWERRLLTGNIAASYSVEELGFLKLDGGKSIPYPKKAILKHYKEGKLRDTERFEIMQISFDAVNDEDLSIDATPTKVIRDLDGDGKFRTVK